MSDRPLVTFFVCAYKQEQFIRQAVEGAFAQTYTPLEIILSDDCSPDRTFEIMQELASNYTGPHRVRLNRTPRNQGISEHIAGIVDMAEGELLLGNAGDDHSSPERTRETVNAWLASDRKAMSIFTNANVIDKAGTFQRIYCETPDPGIPWTLEEVIKRRDCGLFGFSHAFSKELFRVFGPLHPEIVYEDRVIPFRALLLGHIEYLPDCLVNYRLHEANTSAQVRSQPLCQRVYARQRFVAKRSASCARQWVRDLAVHPGPTSEAVRDEFKRIAERATKAEALFGPHPLGGAVRTVALALQTGDLALVTLTCAVIFWRCAARCEKLFRHHS